MLFDQIWFSRTRRLVRLDLAQDNKSQMRLSDNTETSGLGRLSRNGQGREFAVGNNLQMAQRVAFRSVH